MGRPLGYTITKIHTFLETSTFVSVNESASTTSDSGSGVKVVMGLLAYSHSMFYNSLYVHQCVDNSESQVQWQPNNVEGEWWTNDAQLSRDTWIGMCCSCSVVDIPNLISDTRGIDVFCTNSWGHGWPSRPKCRYSLLHPLIRRIGNPWLWVES